MQQFDVKRGSRKCCVTEQLFGPGDVFYSVLLETSSGSIRNDYSSEAWKDSPWSQIEKEEQQHTTSEEDSEHSLIGWWKQRVPDLDSNKVYWAPDHVLIALFDSLHANPSELTAQQQKTAWVMAILLMQKRLLTRQDRDTDGSTMYLINKKTQQEYELHEPELDDEQINEIQNELTEQLFSDRPITETDEEE